VIDIGVNNVALERMAADFAATPQQIEMARGRALRETAKWVRRVSLRNAARKLRIPQKSLQYRFYLSKIPRGASEAELRIGTLPIPVSRVGNPRQSAKGTKVGRLPFFRGAFIGEIYSSQEKVWIRKGSPHYDPARYPVIRQNRPSTLRPGASGRFPVVRAAVPIDDVVEKTADDLEGLLPGRFEHEFGRALNYEVNIKGRK